MSGKKIVVHAEVEPQNMGEAAIGILKKQQKEKDEARKQAAREEKEAREEMSR